MAKKIGDLAVYVSDDAGVVHCFLPGDEVPSWAAKTMGPHCFEGIEDDQEPSGPPPKAGKGSGEPAWRAYAEAQGIDVSQADGRDDIIDTLESAGVPVE